MRYTFTDVTVDFELSSHTILFFPISLSTVSMHISYPLIDVPGKLHESLNLYRDRREQEDDLTFLAVERIKEKDD